MSHQASTSSHLADLDLKSLVLTALKSEIEAERIYLEISKKAKNFMLKDRLKFLAAEEVKHAEFFKNLFKHQFPGESIALPTENAVPLPEIHVEDQTLPLSILLGQAMDAEMAAFHFYTELSRMFAESSETPIQESEEERKATVREWLLNIASMEMGHYRILELEQQNARDKEQYDIVWDMNHLGP